MLTSAFWKDGYGHSTEYGFGETRQCAVDQERDGKCSSSKGREKGQNSAAPRRDNPQNDVDEGSHVTLGFGVGQRNGRWCHLLKEPL